MNIVKKQILDKAKCHVNDQIWDQTKIEILD